MGDLESGKELKIVKPIKSLQNYLKSSFVINHDFHELATKNYKYKLNYGNVLVFLLYFIHAIKYLLHFLTMYRPQLSAVVGHLMRPIGVSGSTVVFGQGLFAFWSSLMVYILAKHQKEKRLVAMADLDMFINDSITEKHVIDGKETVGRTKLWPENYRKFSIHAKIAMIFPPLLGYVWPFFVVPLGVMGTYSGYFSDYNIHLMLYRCVWVVLLFVFVWYYGWFFSLQLVTFYLSSLYLIMRFDQMRTELRHLMGSSKFPVPAKKLQNFLSDFNSLCNRVYEYNRTYCYLLCCMSFCGMGIFTGCVILLMPRHENPIERYVKWPLQIGSLEAMFGLSYFASVAGQIHSYSRSFIPLFNSVLVRSLKRKAVGEWRESSENSASGDIVGKGINLGAEDEKEGTEFNCYPRSIQVQLQSMIFRISSERYPVSFYSYDLYPFTHYAYGNMILETFATILLAIGLVSKLNT